MGRDYQPKIIFGLKIPRAMVFEEFTEPRNDCKCTPKRKPGIGLVPLAAKYCPDCGQNMCWSVRKYRHADEAFKGFAYYDDEKGTVAGWPTDYDTDGHHFFVGYYIERGYYGLSPATEKINMPNMSLEKQFIDDMKRVGLWDKGEYGAWLVLYLSY
jgi:hypothetical protein